LIEAAVGDTSYIDRKHGSMNEALSQLRPRNLGALALEFADVALEAGSAIMSRYGRNIAVRRKPDDSPVTEADEAAEEIVLARLNHILPDVPVVAEEAVARGGAPRIGREFLLVDALDGTREFIDRNDEFTVNVALIRDCEPVCGVVFAPALRRIWISGEWASVAEIGSAWAVPPIAQRKPLRVRVVPDRDLVALCSRSHGDPGSDAFLAALPVMTRKEAGSSLKFCIMAQGEADVYPRFGPTMEWDTAAGDAVLRAAGGIVEDVDGRPLGYGKQSLGFRNCGFVAWGGAALAASDP
jgi:3'(2'), 5'-bisphosphate nucleotidase